LIANCMPPDGIDPPHWIGPITSRSMYSAVASYAALAGGSANTE
jgi:hypothetical protein